MAFSVNTNAQALAALRQLNATNVELSDTQTAINTGLEVASSRDNAAIFAIAQRLRGNVAGLNAVQQSLDRAQSSADVALAAGEAVADLLIDLKERAVAAADAGLDTGSRIALNDDFAQLRDQINSIVQNAEFNGTNAVNGTGADDITAITAPDAGTSITISAQDLSLGGANVTIGTSTSIATLSGAIAAVALVEASIDNVNGSLSEFGAGARRLELQADFARSLNDTIVVGIGNLVDADLAEESANLQALQVKQQLGLQALGIANQAPQAIISLFQ